MRLALSERQMDRTLLALAWAIAILTLVVPLVLVFRHPPSAQEAGLPPESGVGVAVILRTTFRRFLRTSSAGAFRAAASALGRTSARTVTRRIVKAAIRLLAASLLRRRSGDDIEDAPDDEVASAPNPMLSISLGLIALAVSFWGVLEIADGKAVESILGTSDLALSVLTASLLATVPMVVYIATNAIVARMLSVRVSYLTELDGLLLQAYFTGAGSFLPMTTDVVYDGEDSRVQRVATWSIATLIALHFACHFAGEALGSPSLSFAGSMFLIYAFIFIFPIEPLEGKLVWKRSKILWSLIAAVVLFAFVTHLPEAFGEVL